MGRVWIGSATNEPRCLLKPSPGRPTSSSSWMVLHLQLMIIGKKRNMLGPLSCNPRTTGGLRRKRSSPHFEQTATSIFHKNLIVTEFPELYRQTAHFYGRLRGKSPSQGSVTGDKVSQWITQFHRAHSSRHANGMSLTGMECRLTSHAG